MRLVSAGSRAGTLLPPGPRRNRVNIDARRAGRYLCRTIYVAERSGVALATETDAG